MTTKLMAMLAGAALLAAAPAMGQSMLHDNGPLATGATNSLGVPAPAGTEWSEVQSPNILAGNNCNLNVPFRCADDFEVTDAAGWDLTHIEFFSYQTGSTTVSPFTGGFIELWDGRPGDPGSVKIFGDMTTNVLASTTFAQIYRVFASQSLLTRPQFLNRMNVVTHLPQGTYWIVYSATGNLASGPWVPLVTIVGQTQKPGANARVFDGPNNTWIDSFDAGSGTQQDFAFRVLGEVAGGACYPDCDDNGQLNIDDFICFQLQFALQNSYADCDGNGIFNIDDFICFQLAFALGC